MPYRYFGWILDTLQMREMSVAEQMYKAHGTCERMWRSS